jgi:TIR domain-containing protein
MPLCPTRGGWECLWTTPAHEILLWLRLHETIDKVSLASGLERLRIFLCHSSNDKPVVRKLYYRLLNAGFDPWLDERKLLPGQHWEREIKSAVRNSHIVIVCLSKDSTNKRGFVQKEIKYALDIADEQPEGAIFIIPLRLEQCDVPERLRLWHWADLFEVEGYERLGQALRYSCERLGIHLN